MEETFTQFSIRLPNDLLDRLNAEARARFRAGLKRNQMIIEILTERYENKPQVPAAKPVRKARTAAR